MAAKRPAYDEVAATALPFLLLLILSASTDAAARPTISALLAATGPAAHRVGGAGRVEHLARRALQDVPENEPGVEPPEECQQGELKCPSGGGCMLESQVCDGAPHCSDGSDESFDFCRSFDCGRVNKESSCPTLAGCVPLRGECNGVADCADVPPRALPPCSPTVCLFFSFAPLPLLTTGRRPAPRAPGACPRAASATTTRTARTAATLSPNPFLISPFPSFPHWVRQESCPSGTGCMPPGSACNNDADCADGSDEGLQCLGFYPGGYPDDSNYCADQGMEQCPSDSYYACLRQQDFCDGYQTCYDGYDERNCESHVCSSGMIQCPKTFYCARGTLCDGVQDCFVLDEAEDEDKAFCRGYSCPDGFKKCADGLQCVAEGLFCDGAVNCNDGSDEGPASCTTTPPTATPSGGGGSGSGSSGGTVVVLSAEEVARQRKEAAARRAAAVAAKKQAAAAKHAAVEARRAKQEAKAAAIAEKKKKQEEKAAAVAEKKRLQEAKAAAIAEKKRKQEEKAAAIAEKKRKQEEKAAAIAEKKRK
ncbi:unnamed protein product [Closterium sp. Naga37s-1]|nr:unnamed protein product [Closterium sp. Naga37s-1]